MDVRQRRGAIFTAVAAASALLLMALERPVAASQDYAIKQTLAASAVEGLVAAVCLGLALASLLRGRPVGQAFAAIVLNVTLARRWLSIEEWSGPPAILALQVLQAIVLVGAVAALAAWVVTLRRPMRAAVSS